MEPSRKSFSLFLVVWAGQLLSKIGSGVSAFALGVYLLQTTGATSAYSFLLMAAFLPSVLLAPVGGVIADRKDRRLMMATGDLGSALGMGFILVMLLLAPDACWPIYLGAAVSSLFAALQSPAFKATVTDILDEETYAKGSGLIQLAEASQYLLGPILAAVLLSRFSLPVVLGLDMATFAVAALLVLAIRGRVVGKGGKRLPGNFRKDFADGVRYIADNQKVLHLLHIAAAATFLVGILQSVFVPMALSVSDSGTLGAVQSISASGMLIGGLLIGMSSKTGKQGRVLSVSLVTAGFFYILIGASPNAALITCAAFCFFFTLPFVNASLEVLFRQNIDNGMQGRAWSLISLITQTGMVMAFGIAGLLADHLFNPLLTDAGRLSDTVGRLMGTGPSRGSGLMVMVCGLLLLLYALVSAPGGRAPRAAPSRFAMQAK